MDVQEIRPGLWRWMARHPEWYPDQPRDSAGDWPPDVGCVAYGAPDALVLIDPLVPEEDWSAVDALVKAQGKQVAVLQTIQWHERSCRVAVSRYSASTSPPAGIEPIPLPRAGETLFWVPEHGALVTGDRLIGFPEGLRTCPESWLAYLANGITRRELRDELRRLLLHLPIEMVLVSHGEPVLEHGRQALARALAAR